MPYSIAPRCESQRHSPQERRAIANAVRANSYAVAAAALQRCVRRPEVTVGLELTALSFVERFADSVAGDNASILLDWVDGICEKYSHLPAIARLLCAGVPTVASVMGEYSAVTGHVKPDLATLAAQVERIVHRPRLPAVMAANDTLDEIDVVLGELVGRLEAFDPLTAEHSRAVSVWCTRIAKRMSLAPAQVVFIARCGLIHDIGKLTTPPEILSAPRRLTEPEMNVMRRHAEDGSALIAAIPLVAHHTPAVRGHHERLDGRGYPDGLTATLIPVAARIVAVADSFNAMIGNRPYRLPMRPTHALHELCQHAGTQFDPEIIAAMDDVVTKRSDAVSSGALVQSGGNVVV